MSRLSEHYLQLQQEEWELDLSYAEWLRDNIEEPSEEELNKMEQDLLNKSHFVSNRIIAHKHLNNINYTPKQGA